MIWTDAIKADMIRRWKAGDSSGVIAKALGVTRSAVMGRIYRAGLMRTVPLPIVKLPYKPRPTKMLAKPSRKPPEPLGVRLGLRYL